MRISDVAVSVHRFETRLPVVDRPGPSETRVVCRVRTDDGLEGVGMTARFLPAAVAAAIRHHLAPAVIGLDPFRREDVRARLLRLVSERGVANGVNRAALSCIDLALWDIAGKAAGRSVSDLLGGNREEAEAYVTCGFLSLDREEQAALCAAMAREGFRTVKMVVGHPDGLEEDVARVRAVRDAAGPSCRVAIDANELFPVDVAARLARLLRDDDIAWFEDPVIDNEARDLAYLRRVARMAITAGQMDGHAKRLAEYVAHDAVDVFMPNSMYNGGMSETLRVAAIAEAHGKPLSDAGGGGVFCLHHMTAFPGATLAEVHLGTLEIERAAFNEAPRVSGGRVRLPEGPGFGVTLNDDALAATLLPDF